MAEEGQYWKPKEKNVEYARNEYKVIKIRDDIVYFAEISSLFYEDVLLLDTKDFLEGFERTLLPERRIATHSGKWIPKQASWTGHCGPAHWSCCGQKTYNSICAKFLEQ